MEMREGSYNHGLKLPVLGHFAKRKRNQPPKVQNTRVRAQALAPPNHPQDLNRLFGYRWQKRSEAAGSVCWLGLGVWGSAVGRFPIIWI